MSGLFINEKIFEPLDLVELGLGMEPISDESLLNLVKYYKIELSLSTMLIKVLVYYEKISLIEDISLKIYKD